ncbi:type II toxin-antitoxin system Phd/YefM family antitoxin [Streptomyces sp. NPDC003280]|uniref:type II toxin-antitoxin system Phd/YefM family antitoxin n=1 Tax=Streptomyces sp. NPDC003280 TaxID=3364680 RepID=UPI00369EB437
MSITASEARAKLFPLIQQVNDDHEPVEITSRGGNAILMSADDFRSWQETVYLLRSPANAAHLMAAVAADKAADTSLITRSVEELQDLAEDGE